MGLGHELPARAPGGRRGPGPHAGVDPGTGAARRPRGSAARRPPYQPSTYAKISGATMDASDSIMNFGVSTSSLPQVIFSLGTAPE